MKQLFCILFLSGTLILSLAYNIDRSDSQSSEWRKPFYQVPITRRDSSGEDSLNWRNQRAFPYFRIPLSFSDFWNKSEKKDEEKKGPRIKIFTEGEDKYEDSAIGCPPDVAKCIPRLGRK